MNVRVEKEGAAAALELIKLMATPDFWTLYKVFTASLREFATTLYVQWMEKGNFLLLILP